MIPTVLNGSNLTENCAKISDLVFIIIKEYLLYFLNSQQGQYHIRSRTGGASQPKLAIERIRSIPITLPTESLLKEFHNRVKPHHDLIENLTLQNQLLREARDILLPRLMTGMIEV